MIHEINNPIIANKLAQLRNKDTSPKNFRELVEEIAALMTYEVGKNFETRTVEIETPIKSCRVEVLVLSSCRYSAQVWQWRAVRLKSCPTPQSGTSDFIATRKPFSPRIFFQNAAAFQRKNFNRR